MATHPGNRRLSPADLVGFASLFAAILLSFVDVRLSAILLTLFLILCTVAPFLPRFGFFLPIISRGNTGKRAVALTFDDGPDPVSTPALLGMLSRHKIKATFFVTGKNASDHPELVREILMGGHSLGNHSYSHDNLIMFKGSKALKHEIESAQVVLSRFGVIPLAFRPPVGITNPRLKGVLSEAGMYSVCFSCRPVDWGNRWINDLSGRVLRRIRPDDIVLLHDIGPTDEARFSYWLNEIESILAGLKERGLSVLPLSELIGRPVMLTGKKG